MTLIVTEHIKMLKKYILENFLLVKDIFFENSDISNCFWDISVNQSTVVFLINGHNFCNFRQSLSKFSDTILNPILNEMKLLT